MTAYYDIGSLLRYKSWADNILYDSLSQLPDTVLVEKRPMLFGNMLALLNHVFAMDVAWRSNLQGGSCLLYTSPSPRDKRQSRMPSSA